MKVLFFVSFLFLFGPRAAFGQTDSPIPCTLTCSQIFQGEESEFSWLDEKLDCPEFRICVEKFEVSANRCNEKKLGKTKQGLCSERVE